MQPSANITMFITIVSAAILLVAHLFDARMGRLKFFLTTVALLTLATWAFVDSLSGQGLNAATIYHIKTGLAGAGIADFYVQISKYVAEIILIVVVAAGCSLAARKIGRTSRVAVSLYFVAVCAVATFNPLTRDFIRLYGHKNGNLSEVATEYATLAESRPFSKKNVVFIYAESLERTYLDESKFPNLMPNIGRLTEEGLDFTNVRQATGTGWTIAGMVASLCGIPLTTWSPQDANQLNRLNRFLPGATCIGDWLSQEGYTLQFMGGADAGFAGKSKFLSAHGFSTIRDYTYFKQQGLPSTAFSSWGAHDDILLDQAFEQFDNLSQSKTPFLLGVLTLDTHHPSGHVPEACNEQKYQGLPQNYPILDAVSCSDLLISRFVQKIRSSQYGRNTIIVLASDHLGMPNDARAILDTIGADRRNLLVLLGDGIVPAKIPTPATTMDTGATLASILVGEPIQVGFGRSPLYPMTDGFTHARGVGKSAAPYLAFAQSLWNIDGARQIRLLRTGDIRIGSQDITPPFRISIDDTGSVGDIMLTPASAGTSKEHLRQVSIDYCAAYSSSPATEICALDTRADGSRYLHSQRELADGINLSERPDEHYRTSVKPSDNYIIQPHFDASFASIIGGTINNGSVFSSLKAGVLFNGPFKPLAAGTYLVEIRGSTNDIQSSWADVIAEGNKIVLKRGPLQSEKGGNNFIFSGEFSIDHDVKDVEVRVYAGDRAAIRVDSYAVFPKSAPDGVGE